MTLENIAGHTIVAQFEEVGLATAVVAGKVPGEPVELGMVAVPAVAVAVAPEAVVVLVAVVVAVAVATVVAGAEFADRNAGKAVRNVPVVEVRRYIWG